MMDFNGSLTYRFLASIFGDFLYGSLQCHFSSQVYQGRSASADESNACMSFRFKLDPDGEY